MLRSWLPYTAVMILSSWYLCAAWWLLCYKPKHEANYCEKHKVVFQVYSFFYYPYTRIHRVVNNFEVKDSLILGRIRNYRRRTIVFVNRVIITVFRIEIIETCCGYYKNSFQHFRRFPKFLFLLIGILELFLFLLSHTFMNEFIWISIKRLHVLIPL